VDVFYSTGSLFGTCTTNDISGACSVEAIQNTFGSFEVYATASKDVFIGDNSKNLRFNYDVLEEEFLIKDLKVYDNDSFITEDYDFFRGENLFVKFKLTDVAGNLIEDTTLVSNVELISPNAGGRIRLSKVKIVNGEYFYKLTPIPKTHDFIGTNLMFAFVLNLSDGSGAQDSVTLTIRNNLPKISSISSIYVEDGEEKIIDLSKYESDVEDSGSSLSWNITGDEDCDKVISIKIIDKLLHIEGDREGECDLVFKLYDLDNEYDIEKVDVIVEDTVTQNQCYPSWTCSEWSSCNLNKKTRVCHDTNNCDTLINKPVEIMQCEADNGIQVIDLEGNKVKPINSNAFSDPIILMLIIGIVMATFLIMTILFRSYF
jgi:hypothetical protein